MISSYFKNKKPAFFARLSNLIILQILFVFVAFGLLFLYPVEEEIAITNPSILEDKFSTIAFQINECNNENDLISFFEKLGPELDSSLPNLDYISSNVFTTEPNGNLNLLFKSGRDYENNTEKKLIESELKKSGNHFVQIIPSTQKVIYYYTFELRNQKKALLSAEFEHHYFVTSANKVLYSFGLLFLGAVLISLLTVYLINKRIREPLERIMNGLEKTTQGDLYYMVETDKDIELNKLTDSFNKMSRTLWYNDQKLKKYNKTLIESNANLIASREFLHKVLNNSTSSIIATSLDGIIEVFNETASDYFEISFDEAIGLHINKLFNNEFDSDSFDYKSQEEVEVVCRKSDGTVFPAFVLTAPLYDSDNSVSSILYIIRDISESKSIHNLMIQMDRYYTKGEMAGDIAHEINNFLAIISGNIELMPILLKKNDPDKIKSKLDLMKKQVDRIVSFTDGLLEANDGDESFIQVDMNSLLLAVKAFLQPLNLFDYTPIEITVDENIPLVHTKIGQIRQMFVTLVYNAGEALKEIEGDKTIFIQADLTGDEDNKTVTISVQDNGPGIPEENVDYLFQKRFSTKANGNGIGLVACQKIVETHFGSIQYAYNNGALFTVVLPVTQDVDEQEDNNQRGSHFTYA